MLLDTIATLQGVIDADIDQSRRICRAIQDISFPGIVGRRVCRYVDLLRVLARIELHWTEMSKLWKKLGPSMASGFIVASDEPQ